jgi:hypothetical protein
MAPLSKIVPARLDWQGLTLDEQDEMMQAVRRKSSETLKA